MYKCKFKFYDYNNENYIEDREFSEWKDVVEFWEYLMNSDEYCIESWCVEDVQEST